MSKKIDPKTASVAELCQNFEENPDFKGDHDITVAVNGISYKIPYYCLPYLFGGQPDSFFPCNRYEHADHPRYFTTIEMTRTAIEQNPQDFVAFILYGKK